MCLSRHRFCRARLSATVDAVYTISTVSCNVLPLQGTLNLKVDPQILSENTRNPYINYSVQGYEHHGLIIGVTCGTQLSHHHTSMAYASSADFLHGEFPAMDARTIRNLPICHVLPCTHTAIAPLTCLWSTG